MSEWNEKNVPVYILKLFYFNPRVYVQGCELSGFEQWHPFESIQLYKHAK